MPITLDGINGITFPDFTIQNTAGGPGGGGGGGLAAVVMSNSGTFEIPSSSMKITVVGGGGGGGTPIESGGGGAGGAAIKWANNLPVGSILTVTIGNGGAAYTAGGTSSVIGAGLNIQATGGGTTGGWHGGPGGIGSGGDISIRGGPGESYGRQVYYPCGGSSILGGGGSPGPGGGTDPLVNGDYPFNGGGGRAGMPGGKGVVVFEYSVAAESSAPEPIGYNQQWQLVSRAASTYYQNTTNKPIMVSVQTTGGYARVYVGASTSEMHSVGFNNAPGSGQYEQDNVSVIVPRNHFYYITGPFSQVYELR